MRGGLIPGPFPNIAENGPAKNQNFFLVIAINNPHYKFDRLVKSRIMPFFWIPAYAGMTVSGLISGKYGTRHTREGGYPDVKLAIYDFINIKACRHQGFQLSVVSVTGDASR